LEEAKGIGSPSVCGQHLIEIPRYEGTLGEQSYSGPDLLGGWSGEGPGVLPLERNSVSM
jgi:hypothetical protein